MQEKELCKIARSWNFQIKKQNRKRILSMHAWVLLSLASLSASIASLKFFSVLISFTSTEPKP